MKNNETKTRKHNKEKITAGIPSGEELFTVGQYRIGRYKRAKNALWIETLEGEGMVVPEVDLDMILQGYFKENF